jgi:Lon protease-like protein
MRQVATIPDSIMRVVIHEYNGKYIVEFEGGQCRQAFKFDKESTPLQWLQETWVPQLREHVLDRFDLMHQDLFKLPKT